MQQGSQRSLPQRLVSRIIKPTRVATTVTLLHLLWSTLVYFGSLNREAHSWWPLGVPWVLLPLGPAIERIAATLSRAGAQQSNRAFVLNDQIAGALYIVVGALRVWVIAFVAIEQSQHCVVGAPRLPHAANSR